jgi:hypothetical protein
MKPLDTDDGRQLTDVLQRLRENEARVEPPPHVRNAVMAAWDSGSPQSLPRRSGAAAKAGRTVGLWRSAAALAAGVILVAGLARLGSDLRSEMPTPPVPASTATVHLVGEAFAEGEALRVVRMRMAPATLASLGIRSTAGDLAESVDVDVIVGEDGVARAIRVGM